MIYIRKNKDRGLSQTDWLHSLHTFSFGHYTDAAWTGFGSVRVINEDTVQAGCGFGRHSHHDMEIISYVVDGSLAHRDSMGNGSVIQAGDIQVISAGSGVEHSEFNHSAHELVHFLQIWITPEAPSLKPSYQQKSIQQNPDEWILIASREEHAGAVIIHQDVQLYAAFLTGAVALTYPLPQGRMGWLQLISGQVKLNGQVLSAGDGAGIRNVNLTIQSDGPAKLLFFDLKHA
jgi:redox-sensitive bicupin YhaK (pirin superfamily)